MRRRLKITEQYQQGSPRRQVAAALRYDPGENGAPRVVAAGERKVAEQILELARRNGIPIYDDPALAGLLAQVNLGEEIPPELYQVVAEVLAYIYRIVGKVN